MLKIKLLLSEKRYASVAKELIDSGHVIDDEAELLLTERQNHPDHLMAKDAGTHVRLALSQVTFIESLGHDIVAHSGGKSYRLSERLVRLQTILKRRQYAALAGYVSRELQGEQELSRMCFAFVPLLIEAIWSQHAEASLEELTKGLRLHEMTRKPREALLDEIDQQAERLERCLTLAFSDAEARLKQAETRLKAREPEQLLSRYGLRLENVRQRLDSVASQRLQQTEARLRHAETRLRSSGPQETLRRGYAVALKDGRLLKSTADAAAGDAVRLMLQDGSLLTRVETVETER